MNPIDNEKFEKFRPYLNMKTSLDIFGKIVSELTSTELEKCKTLVEKQIALHRTILRSPEALKIQITSAQVTHSIKELERRFPKVEDFETTLEANDLDRKSLSEALYYELHSDTVLEYASQNYAKFTEQDAQSYYFSHLDKFKQPERRKASHILITINDQFPENKRNAAYARLSEIRQEITPETFGSFATRHSECPTAMNEGQLGMVERKTLHPELDDVLYSMTEQTISAITESEVGFHLIYCEEIIPAHTVPFKDAQAKIIEQLNASARNNAKKAWIANLLATQTNKVAAS